MSNLHKPNGAKLSHHKIGGVKKMAEKETVSGMFGNVANLGAKLINVEGAKKFAAWYIDTSEKVAKQAIEMQASATKWAKETPLAPIFDGTEQLISITSVPSYSRSIYLPAM